MEPNPPNPLFAALLLLVVLSGLDQTVLGTMLPTIASRLGHAELAPWVFTAYLTTATIAVPVYGKSADRFGPWPVLLSATGLFTLGSAACAVAPDMPMLVAARAVQGLGGGGLMTLALLSVAWLYPPAERGRRMGMIGAATSLATLAGPLAGGTLLRWLPWPSAFLINLPCAALAWLVIRRHRFGTLAARPAAPFDLLGATLLGSALAAGLWALRQPIDSLGARTAAALCAALVIAWLVAAQRAVDPIVPLTLFRDAAFRAAAGLSALGGVVLFGAVVFVPLYLQTGRRLDALHSAFCVLPLMLGITLGAQFAGRRLRAGRSLAGSAALSGLLMGFGTAALALLLRTGTPPVWLLAVALLPLGLGLGLGFPLTTIVAQRRAPLAQLGAASALPVMLRSLGGALAVALLGELLHRQHGGIALGTSAVFGLLTVAAVACLPLAWALRGSRSEAVPSAGTGASECVQVVSEALASSAAARPPAGLRPRPPPPPPARRRG